MKNFCDLETLLRHDKVAALGEIGLDYSYKNDIDRDVQKASFMTQLELAMANNLAVCLHIREADQDGQNVLEEAKVPRNYPIHLHCFNSSWEVCESWLNKYSKLKIGITPLITYDNADNLHEVVQNIPLNRLILETDSPYFLPKDMDSISGYSHPGFIIHSALSVAKCKNISVEEVIEANQNSVKEIYNVPFDANFRAKKEHSDSKHKDTSLHDNSDQISKTDADLKWKSGPPDFKIPRMAKGVASTIKTGTSMENAEITVIEQIYGDSFSCDNF